MKKILNQMIIAGFLAVLFVGSPLTAQKRVVVIKKRPPVVKVEIKPRAPFARAVWVPGHWRYHKKDYVWVKGKWVKPRRGYRWVGGHWAKRPGGWVWIGGHWRKA